MAEKSDRSDKSEEITEIQGLNPIKDRLNEKSSDSVEFLNDAEKDKIIDPVNKNSDKNSDKNSGEEFVRSPAYTVSEAPDVKEPVTERADRNLNSGAEEIIDSSEKSVFSVKTLLYTLPLFVILGVGGYYFATKLANKTVVSQENTLAVAQADDPVSEPLDDIPESETLEPKAATELEKSEITPPSLEKEIVDANILTPNLSEPVSPEKIDQSAVEKPVTETPVTEPGDLTASSSVTEQAKNEIAVSENSAVPPQEPQFISAISPSKYQEAVIAVRNLRKQAETGKPFTYELTKVKLAFNEDIRLPVLEKRAAIGIFDDAELIDAGLKAVREASILLYSQEVPSGNLINKITNFFRKNIIITPINADSGREQDDLTALILSDLKAGRFESAGKRVHALPNRSQKPFENWMRDVEEKNAVRSEMEVLEDMIFKRLFPGDGSSVRK